MVIDLLKFWSVMFFFVVLGCTPEPKVELSDGFTYFREFGTVHAIAKPNGRVLVLGDVHYVRELKNFIIGKRIPVDPFLVFDNGVEDQPYGYFIYNKEAESLIMGLSEK